MSKNSRTLVGFNPNQELHFNTVHPNHPECPNRIFEITKQLEVNGILEQCQVLEEFPPIDQKLLEKVHSKQHLDSLQTIKSMSQEDVNKFSDQFHAVNLTKDSFDAALESAGCAVHLTQLLVENKIDNGFALIRPPGHHAQHSCSNGFCVLNNVVLAARHAETLGTKRILIVDFDVHHGQGTQYQFYDSNNVLYFSAHRYENGSYWPHLRESEFDFIGDGEGKGFNVNVPVNETYVKNLDYMHIFWSILYPIAVEFKPELILYSAGFDSCGGDPLGQLDLTPDLYACWIHNLKAVCNKQLLLLEGGYNHRVLALCVQKCLDVLLGGLLSIELNDSVVKQSTLDTCNNCIHILKPYWAALESLASKTHVAKSQYTLIHGPSTNTGDVNQRDLKIPFDQQKCEKRLDLPKMTIAFENDKSMKDSESSLLYIQQKWTIKTLIVSQFSHFDQLDKLTLLVGQNAIPLKEHTINIESTHGSNEKDVKFKVSTFNNLDENAEEWIFLDLPSVNLKLHTLLTKNPNIRTIAIKINYPFDSTLWKLAWNLQIISHLSILVFCPNFCPIKEELKQSGNFFNLYSSVK